MRRWLFAGSCIAAGCEGEAEVDERLAATSAIRAEQGGEIRLDDGAVLTVPPGALEADADVTFSRERCKGIYAHGAFAGCLYEVDAGTVPWVGRYEVALPRRDGGGARAVASAFDGLRPLPDTVDGATILRASGSRSARIASRFVEVAPPDDRCVDPDFEPCGGEVEGEWTLASACGTTEQVAGIYWEGPDPYAACDEHDYLVDYPFSAQGSVTFGTGGAFAAQGSFRIEKHETVTTQCLAAAALDCHPDCALEDDVCDCLWEQATGGSAREDVWSYGDPGTVLVGETPLRYCVEGDVLTVEFRYGDAARYEMIYERSTR